MRPDTTSWQAVFTKLRGQPLGKPVNVSDRTFDAEVTQSTIPVLVDFWAAWCGPCRMVAPVVEQLAQENEGKLKVAKLEVDQNPVVAQRFMVMSIPTLILFKGGKEVERVVGYTPKDRLQPRINPHLGKRMSAESVFISYAREDAAAAMRLYSDLRDVGLQPWLDQESLLPGQKWRSAITRAIENSRFFIALLSSRSVNRRGFVNKEIAEALEILVTYPESDIYLIPARLDECQPSHEKLRHLNWVDMFPDWEAGLAKIVRAIKADLPVSEASKIANDPLQPKLSIEFYPGPPFEQSNSIIDGNGKRLPVQQRLYRIAVRCTIPTVALDDVTVELAHVEPSIIPFLPIPLHQMHDNPSGGQPYKCNFGLNPGETKYIDIVSIIEGNTTIPFYDHFTFWYAVRDVANVVPAQQLKLTVLAHARNCPSIQRDFVIRPDKEWGYRFEP